MTWLQQHAQMTLTSSPLKIKDGDLLLWQDNRQSLWSGYEQDIQIEDEDASASDDAPYYREQGIHIMSPEEQEELEQKMAIEAVMKAIAEEEKRNAEKANST